MNMSTARYYTLSLSALFLCFAVLTGCSVDSNPISSNNEDTSTLQESASNPAEIPYPFINEADIDNLIPGYEIVQLDARAIEAQGTLDDQSSRFVRRLQGGTVSHRNNGIEIGAWQLWQDQTVTVSTPCPGYPIVDFYPHPYQFNGHVRIWIDLTYVQLPPGVHWWDIEMFYVNDNGEYERYWGYVDEQARQYIAWTDHFSRYILAIRRNSR